MRMPRIGIAWLMAIVALAAVNFSVIRMDVDRNQHGMQCWSVSTLPMLNIMVIGLVVYWRKPESRGFVLGFLIFGATALGNYVRIVTADDSWVHPFLSRPRNAPSLFLSHLVLSTLATLPQLALALLGGYLTRNFGRVERRNLNPAWEHESTVPEANSPAIS